MVKIIVAFATDEKCAQYSSVLEEAGFPVFRRCKSGSEVKRTMNECYDGIVICSSRLPDITADSLAWDLGGRALMLVTGRPAQLELCEHPDIFRLMAPCSKGELTSAVNMLTQLHQMRLPRRSGEERKLVNKAKELLITKHGMTEPEAHHHLQKGAMNSGMKLADYAAKLLEIL